MTLNGILRGFSETIAQLEKLAEQNRAKFSANASRIEALVQENQALSGEAAKADIIANKLRALVND